jgi:pyruvate dehydrogenase E2 component (dihydrolipoamide acetyltransferase)
VARVFVMPKLGLTMDEGVLAGWVVGLDEVVEVGQDLCEVETEKLTTVVESPFAGTLLRRVEPGLTVPVGEPIAVIGEEGEDATSYALFSGSPAGVAPLADRAIEPSTASAPSQGPPKPRSSANVAASPLARQLAARFGIDVGTLIGTGPDGRVTKDDVERAAAAGNEADGSSTADPK